MEHLPKSKIRPPVAIAMGSPREAARVAGELALSGTVCYQMDLYQAARLEANLAEQRTEAKVAACADLWDLPGPFRTVIYPAPEAGERSLNIDIVEQAFHLLEPGGVLIVQSPHQHDQHFGAAMKKAYKHVEVSCHDAGSTFWSRKDKDRPRRRHELTFHARLPEGPSLAFLSRPGTFSYGRMDDGARAMVETMQVERGQRVLDLGCGCGTNGVFASLQAGPMGHVVFVDSNVRAIALTQHNARANGVSQFEAVATAEVDVGPPGSFDVVLANPPYYADGAIAQMFLQRSREQLREGGRLYLVSKMMDRMGQLVVDEFPETLVVERRGYCVFCCEN